jgi:hypothetical protein
MDSNAVCTAEGDKCRPPESGVQKESCGDDAERSAYNIREWRSYLPPECVESMIRMGWDIST